MYVWPAGVFRVWTSYLDARLEALVFPRSVRLDPLVLYTGRELGLGQYTFSETSIG
jgi:hypothetical protein